MKSPKMKSPKTKSPKTKGQSHWPLISVFQFSMKTTLLWLAIGLALGGMAWQRVEPAVTAQSNLPTYASLDGVWTALSTSAQSSAKTSIATRQRNTDTASPGAPKLFQLNASALQQILHNAPREVATASTFGALRRANGQNVNGSVTAPVELDLPLPTGEFVRFALIESPTMEPALAARYPNIKSYRGESVGIIRNGRSNDGSDNGSSNGVTGSDTAGVWQVRLDWSPLGLHATLASDAQLISVQPAFADDITNYVSLTAAQSTLPAATLRQLQSEPECQVLSTPATGERSRARDTSLKVALGSVRRNFRLAVATTYEYTTDAALGKGSVSTALASVNSWVNSVNLIYERDLSIHFNLVANNDQLIYTTSADPFTQTSAMTMVDEARTAIPARIGASSFDVGHVLGIGNTGLAYLNAGCDSTYKAGGVSLIAAGTAVGHLFYITRIAHELGHQFGADHSYNDSGTGCTGGRAAESAVESGSGLTVMSYASACNLITTSRAPHFHGYSIGQIEDYLSFSNCSTQVSTGNTPPTVNAGSDYRIPRQTPFALTATATDANTSDALSYSWEQVDAGGTLFVNPPFTDASDSAGSTRPIFRPYVPNASPTRYFPSLAYILNNANVPPATQVENGFTINTAESLPNVARVLNFKVTVRDGRGGVTDDAVVLTVEAGAGPFAVTAPNTAASWTGGTAQTVRWNVNNTNAAPISCANVRILLSTDGGQTFPHVVLGNTPNDGSEAITVPSGFNTTTARLKVEAVGNIFFDISDANFTLTPGSAPVCPTITSITPASNVNGGAFTLTGNNLQGVSAVTFTGNANAVFQVVSNTSITGTVPAGATSGPVTITKSGCPAVQSASVTVQPCSFTVDAPNVQNVMVLGATLSLHVIPTAASCAWSASSNAGWLTITSNASGTGDGYVTVAVAANTGSVRSGTLTVAGKTITVTQLSGCALTLSKTTEAVQTASATTGTLNVTTANGSCPWTVTSNAAWLTITNGATRTGSSAINFSVAANTGAARTGTITINDQSVAGSPLSPEKIFTVTQVAAPQPGNPIPVAGTVAPTFAYLNDVGFTLAIRGSSFVNGATVQWNGTARPTTFVSATQLTAAIPASDLTTAGAARVTVVNPPSSSGGGGGTSSVMNFDVARRAATVSAASFTSTECAPEQIVAIFGEGFVTTTQSATTRPLPTTLGGVTVKVRDSAGVERLAPLFFVSPRQINYQMPQGMANGVARVTVVASNGVLSFNDVTVRSSSPGMFTVTANGQGLATGVVLRVRNGTQSYEPLVRWDATLGRFVAVPINLGPTGDAVYLVLYGTGIRGRTQLSAVTCTIGGVAAPVAFAGAQNSLVGLDQNNILLPRTLAGRGEVDVAITVDGRPANVVRINVQ